MTTITLTNNSTAVTVYLQGDGKSFIGDDSVRKESLLSPLPRFGADSDQTDVFDFGGTIKTVNLSGVFIGADKNECLTFIQDCEGFIQGEQDPEHGFPVTLTYDEYRASPLLVKVGEFESVITSGSPLVVRWSIKLWQSSTTG